MFLGSDVWLNEKQICALWEETGKYQEVYLAYKTGRDARKDGGGKYLEYTMLGRSSPVPSLWRRTGLRIVAER